MWPPSRIGVGWVLVSMVVGRICLCEFVCKSRIAQPGHRNGGVVCKSLLLHSLELVLVVVLGMWCRLIPF